MSGPYGQSVTSERMLHQVPAYCERCGMSKRYARVMVLSAFIEGILLGVAVSLGLAFLAFGNVVP